MDDNKSKLTLRKGFYVNPAKFLKLKIKVLEKEYKSVSHWLDEKIDELLKS